MKKMNKKGFTLAELLIVVAIIAVLVAVAIPVFTAQLEKSRDAVSVSNMRAAYAEAAAAKLSGGGESNVTVNTDGTVEVSGVAIKSQKGDTWSNLATDLPFTPPDDPGAAADKTMVFTWTDDSSVSAAWKS